MSNSASEKLALVKDLINEYKIEEALRHVKDIEQKENLTTEEALRTLTYKANIHVKLGQFNVTLKIAEELYYKSQEFKKPLFTLDALYFKEIVYYYPQPTEDFYNTLEQHENLFNSIPREESLEYQEREALLLLRKGMREFNKGDLNLALDYYEKSLKLFEQIDPYSSVINFILMGIAYAYTSKGELDLALEYTEKTLSLLPEGENFNLKLIKVNLLYNLGLIYWWRADLDSALEYLIRALEICKEIKYPLKFYVSIIYISLTKNDLAQAHYYLEELKQDTEKPESDIVYQTSYALILKASPRIRDHFEAATILKKINEKFHLLKYPKSTASTFLKYILLVSLSDLYFEEFRLTNQMEVLDDIQPFVDQLQKHARQSNSYKNLADVKLLQAKLALLQINIGGARRLLTEAQQIADDHGLQLLAGEISREHDHLLEELKIWDSIKKTQSSVAERLKLASVDTVIERLQGRRAIEPPEVISEEPILLIIMGKEGVSYFNHNFIQNWDFDDLFSAFLSAFNTFSSEIFSKSIDRIKIDENVILIKPIEPYLVCYVIKGQSYPAQKKLTRFSEAIKSTEEIWDALNRAVKTSEMLELDNPSALGSVVKEIFV